MADAVVDLAPFGGRAPNRLDRAVLAATRAAITTTGGARAGIAGSSAVASSVALLIARESGVAAPPAIDLGERFP